MEIDKQRSVCQRWLAEFKTQITASEPQSYRWVLYQYRLGQIEALLQWLGSYGKDLGVIV